MNYSNIYEVGILILHLVHLYSAHPGRKENRNGDPTNDSQSA